MTPAPGRGARPRLDPARAAVAFVGDEAVVLDLRDYTVLRANPAAALALRLMDGRRTVAGIARAAAARFAVAPEAAAADLTAWLRALRRRGLTRPPGRQ